MERADFSNSVNGEPAGHKVVAENRAGAEEDGAGTNFWPPILRQVVQSKDIAFVAIWNVDASESNLIAEAGQLNPKIFFGQRLECCESAQRGSGNIPLVVQKSEFGSDILIMSFLILARGSQRVGMELQFADNVKPEDGTNAIQAVIKYVGSLGWPMVVSNNDGIGRRPSAHPRLESVLHEQDYRRFVRQVHLSLDPKETSYAVANECRRLLGCERVTVLWFQRGRFVVKAISGQPAVNRRSKWVQLLEQLANRTLRVGRGLDYPAPDPLPPQIAKPLETYLLESRSRSLTILPICERDPNLESEEADLQKKRRGANRVIAGLVLESLTAAGEYHGKTTALLSAQEIGGDALRLANRHRQLFLYPLWDFVGRTKTMALARRLPVTAIVSLVLIGLLALGFFPATFYVSSEGTLVPQVQQRVYAPMDGIVEAVLVKPNDLVGVGQPLLRMRNFELDVKVRQVEGQLEMVKAQIELRHRLDRAPTNRDYEFWNQLDGMPINVLEAQQANLRTQLSLLQQQTQLSVVSSQVAGRVLTWNVQEELQDRPVPMGRLLMEVADTDGQWELELNLPDRRVGHLLEAMAKNDESLRVEFVMAAEPTRRFSARVTKVAPVTAASTEDGSYVKVRVALEAADVRVLQTNTDVSAKIICGQACLGYVWLQDVFEFVERQVFFYLW